jgi:eukaryotic-like serine/threonine-protein kinase
MLGADSPFSRPESRPTTNSLNPAPRVPGPAFAFLSAPEAPGEIGRLGGYRVLSKLGEGSQGVVFLAQDPALLRQVALKVIKPEAASSPRAKERFLREARVAAALRSDHVVTIYHVGEVNGLAFQAMEYLKGWTLKDWLAANGGRVSPPTLLRVAPDVFRALAAVHEKGLVHRDVKPSNLWLEKRGGGRIKLFDFGLTRQEKHHGRVPRRSSVVGTPAYMSPEQARGEAVDARADLYSAGVVLYRMLAGSSPFQRESKTATLHAVVTEAPPPLSEVVPGLPDRLLVLVRRLLDKDPAKRPRTAWMVLASLGQIVHDIRAPVPQRLSTAAPRLAGAAAAGGPPRRENV